jgi:hypothetical protein
MRDLPRDVGATRPASWTPTRSGLPAKPGLSRVIVQGLALRLLVVVLLNTFASGDTFAPDQGYYFSVGRDLASYWSGDLAFAPPNLTGPGRLEGRGYFYVVGLLFYVFGSWPFLPGACNALVGAAIIWFVYDIAQRLTGRQDVALRAARFVAFFPSLMLWSSVGIRDVWVLLFIVVAIRETAILHEKYSFMALARGTLAMLALTQFRSYLLFALALPIVISFVLRGRRHFARNTTLAMLLALAVVYADSVAGFRVVGGRLSIEQQLQALQEMRRWSSTAAGSGFAAGADISTPTGALAFLPLGLFYFLFAPFPWMLGSIRQIVAVPEMLFWYSLMPAMVRGGYLLLRQRRRESLFLLLLLISLSVGYAVGQGNIGTMFRHRAQVLPIFLILAAAGRRVQLRTDETAARGDPRAPRQRLAP